MNEISLKLLYGNESFQIGLDKDFSLIKLSFLKNPNAEIFRNAYSLALDAALNKAVKFWLTDATQIKIMEKENQVWLMAKMGPLLKSNQISRFAIVMAPECYVMTNPNQVYEKPNTGPETKDTSSIKVHFDMEAALNWLLAL